MYSYLRTFFYLPINSIAKLFMEIFIFDRQIRRILKGKWAKLYLKKYVKNAIKYKIKNNIAKNKKIIIWQYWDQGLDNAPEIVKQCIKSAEKYKNGNKHIVLDSNTISDYIDIPDYIIRLNKEGIIKSAHFSDYIRTCLLAKYGGIWVDSTVLFTQDIPDFVITAELFVFQNELKMDLDGLNIANYFIASKANNKIIYYMKSIIENYWKENRFVWNYFFYLHCFAMLTQMNEELKKEFSKIPFFSFIPVQRFQDELMNEYQVERWEEIKSMSFVHKLSYKTSVINKHNLDTKNTFYHKLLKGELV